MVANQTLSPLAARHLSLYNVLRVWIDSWSTIPYRVLRSNLLIQVIAYSFFLRECTAALGRDTTLGSLGLRGIPSQSSKEV